MGDAPKEIKIRHIKNCLQADEAYGTGVAKELMIALSEVKQLKTPAANNVHTPFSLSRLLNIKDRASFISVCTNC